MPTPKFLKFSSPEFPILISTANQLNAFFSFVKKNMQGPKNTDDIPDNSDVSINHRSYQLNVVSMTKDKKSFIISTTKLINIVELSIRAG